MALNKAKLTTDIQKAFKDAKKIEEEPPVAAELLAQALANAIDEYVRGAAVTGVQCTVPVNLSTSSVGGHLHNVAGTLTATQNVDGTLR